MRFADWSLRAKLITGFLVVGMIPALVLGFRTWSATDQIGEGIGASYRTTAASIGDLIDRNLFERYGDVQAFGLNQVLDKKSEWYEVGSAKNEIAAAANDYVALYGIYYLSFACDLDGRVIAVNDKDSTGRSIDTAWMYHENYGGEDWFRDARQGNFLESSVLTGTTVNDVTADESVKRACGGDGLAVGFSAPIKDDAGNVIGVWHNLAKFSLVEEIVQTAYADLKQQGLEHAHLTLINRAGQVILDYDPTTQGSTEVRHDMAVLLHQNLVQDGFAAAQALQTKEAGDCRSMDPKRHVRQVVGYARTRGALGYPGLGWATLMRMDEKEAMAGIWAIRRGVITVLLLSVVALAVCAWLLARSLSRPLQSNVEGINLTAEQVSTVAEQVAASSQSLAQSSTENAASLEETSASMSEMNSMTQRNAENAQEAASYMSEVHRQVEQSRRALESMITAMRAISDSSGKVSRIIKTIDEIAFQTNILALNAAVEAARAGDAGMGFAVVADEVRNLAQRSAEAAKSTSQLIAESIENAEQGGSQVDQLNNAVAGITESVNRVKVLIDEVSMASRQQSQGFEQIASAVSQMEKVTQTIAASAEESAAAGQELTSQARNARAQVAQLQAIIAGASAVTNREESPAHARGNSNARRIVSAQFGGTQALNLTSRTTSKRTTIAPTPPTGAAQALPLDDDDFFAQTGTDF
ncbi:MAG: methyl-accepting chemotaxis protein [Candidatus Eisenbacteria bacterium]